MKTQENSTQKTNAEYVVFDIGDYICGLDIGAVQEINKHLEPTPVHGSPDYVLGITNLRGQILTVISLRKRFGLSQPPLEQNMRHLVVRWEERTVSLLADSVSDILKMNLESMLQTPSHLPEEMAKYIGGVYELDQGVMVVLDIKQVLASQWT
ncbi:MAG: purine-binding chemotaxis protein CheW [Proteobacteria bacterium]|nr:purine-binding chemotaxis protein CheW [Pseudomonadota bacterium]